MSLSFKGLAVANKRRCETGFKRLINDVAPTEWACALAGEVGEACNLIYKLANDRKHNGEAVTAKMIGKELADAQTYLDLLAQRLGIDLGEATRAKFNEVSDRIGSEVKL